MSKFVVLLVVASLVAGICESKPRRHRRSADGDFDDDDDSPLGGAFDPFTSFFSALPKPSDFIDNIKNLAIPPNGHAIGHARTESHKSETVNGKEVLNENNSDEVYNKDGRISEEKTDD